ncbi:M24 family metallopeptidase, partial [Streptomyces laculatispora]|uniref:M24 family metallopeptidase n=1 Tax=Streptomyces laculatispora TaxID=887464 RepID=UPI001A93E26F
MSSPHQPAPFTADDYRARMARAAESAAAAGLAGVLVAPGPDLVYLTGYRPTAITERLTVLVLAAGQDPVLVVPTLEAPDAEQAVGAPALTLRDWTDGKDPYAVTAPLLDAKGRFGISDNAWAMHLLGLQQYLPGTSYASLTEVLPMLRAVKDAAELERIAAAGAAADATYAEILKVRFAGRAETEVAADLARLLTEYGHSQVDFTVVGSGPNGANPHHEAGGRTIERGDMVVLDFGGLKHGYGSDTSRTVHVGEPTAEEQRVHDIVREAQEAGCNAVRPGAACQDIDRAARAVITEFGYGDRFIHRTGHGIGVTTHEPPYMIEGEEQPLVPGMCFSVEPG